MTTSITHEAKIHLSRYLAELEKGKEFVIARGKSAGAVLVPLKKRLSPDELLSRLGASRAW